MKIRCKASFVAAALCLVRLDPIGMVRADAPAGHFVPARGTVVDSATRLVWQQAAPTMKHSWTEAEAYCASLDLDGRSWRLPTVKELQTLIDETRSKPAIDPTAFPETMPDYYWSSSPVTGASGDAWAVHFRFGFDGALAVDELQHVRCVR